MAGDYLKSKYSPAILFLTEVVK